MCVCWVAEILFSSVQHEVSWVFLSPAIWWNGFAFCIFGCISVLYFEPLGKYETGAVYNAGWKTWPVIIVHTDLGFLVDPRRAQPLCNCRHYKESHALLHGSATHHPHLFLCNPLTWLSHAVAETWLRVAHCSDLQQANLTTFPTSMPKSLNMLETC